MFPLKSELLKPQEEMERYITDLVKKVQIFNRLINKPLPCSFQTIASLPFSRDGLVKFLNPSTIASGTSWGSSVKFHSPCSSNRSHPLSLALTCYSSLTCLINACDSPSQLSYHTLVLCPSFSQS